MKDELQNKIISLIEKGEGIAPEIANELLNECFVIGVIQIIIAALCIIVATKIGLYLKKKEPHSLSESKATLAAFGIVFGGFFGIIFLLFGVYKFLSFYLWPNSYILKAIMGGS